MQLHARSAAPLFGSLALVLLCACPAQEKSPDAGAASPGSAAPPRAGIAPAAAGAYPEGWPLAAITLPDGATPAALPESVAGAYMEPGVLTADGSGMHKAMPDLQTDYWYLSFASSADPASLLAHFDACARAAGLAPDKANSAAPGLCANYADAAGTTGLSIQPLPDETGGGQPPRYLIFLQQRSTP